MTSFRFEKLEVWHRAIELADVIYDATLKFPVDERFGLVSQMRRAAVSISSNIAEGSGRASDREFARFVEISYGSLMEVVSQSHIARKRGFFDDSTFETVVGRASEVARMLSGLKASLERG